MNYSIEINEIEEQSKIYGFVIPSIFYKPIQQREIIEWWLNGDRSIRSLELIFKSYQ